MGNRINPQITQIAQIFLKRRRQKSEGNRELKNGEWGIRSREWPLTPNTCLALR
jgi:hypothetical protein